MNTEDLKTLLEACDEELQVSELFNGNCDTLTELRKKLHQTIVDINDGLIEIDVNVRDKSELSSALPIAVKVEACQDGSIEIRPSGYGDCSSQNGSGCPVIVESWDGDLRLVVWGDINKEDPTNIISLAGAQESWREQA